MIAKLKGLVDTIGDTYAIIDVQGVGYFVSCSKHTLQQLPSIGSLVSLYIETIIRPEQITLVGFITPIEQSCCRQLMTVQGVGIRVCLAIMSVLNPNQISKAIMLKDTTAFTQADGVGPKLATRIVNELKDKVGQMTADTAAASSITISSEASHEDLISALLNLGYKRPEITATIAHLVNTGEPLNSISTAIPKALKILGSK